MIEHEKAPFKAMMKAVTQLFNKQELDQELLRLWWHKLHKYDYGMVTRAFDKWIDTNKKMPMPADILELCKAQEDRLVTAKLPKPAITEEQLQENLQKLNVVKAALKPSRDKLKWAKDIMKLHGQGQYKNELGIKYAKEVLRID